MTASKANIDRAEHLLYKVYWRLSLSDILFWLGERDKTVYAPTKENKKILHDFHKRVLNYDSIAGRSHEVVSRFIAEVTIFWSERGIFVRTSGKQKLGLEDEPLSEIWKLL
jgi:hypothetical protein